MNLSSTVEYLRTILRYLNLSFSILCCFLLPLPQSQFKDNLYYQQSDEGNNEKNILTEHTVAYT